MDGKDVYTTVSSAIFDEQTVHELREALRGKLIRSGEPGYEEARQIYNGMIDKHPQCIVRCADIDDVITAVNFAHDHNLETAIRSGGHSGPGLSSVNDGLVIDLSDMKGIQVDPEARTARVEPGCTWGEVDHATHPFGLAAVSGVI